jgi:hypothetical protein
MSGSGAPRRGARLLLLSAAVTVAMAWGLIWPDGALAETFTVTNTQDSGKGSLRQAILGANGRMGADTIRFRIEGKGVKTIRPQSPLPTITTDALTIDGYTQRDAERNTLANGTNAKLKIQLDGTNAGATAFAGLQVGAGADGSRISGLVINRFDNAGISIEASGCSVSGNFVGTNVAGNTDLGNGSIGVNVFGGDGNTIGGDFSNARNLISGNDDHGVRIDGASTDENAVRGNLIGTNAAGSAALANAGAGVALPDGPSGSRIGGVAGARNVISGNGRSGIYMVASNSVVEGNFIGTNATGDADLGNDESGIFVEAGGDNLIGGTSNGVRNVISGNTDDGITIEGSSGNEILGNRIGTTANGDGRLGNGVDGVSINSANNTVGGTVSGAANVIAANQEEGVRLVGAGATGNTLQGNFIGTNAAGSTGLGNTSDGVLVIGGAFGNTIGGAEVGAGNVITGSPAAGVVVFGSGTIGNRILSNRIFGNGGLGIDLDGSGVTANDGDNPLTPTIDETDADTGANNLQNFPTISNVSRNAGTLTASGTLNSTRRQTFTIQCFLTGRSPDASGHGEGRTLVDQTDVVTSAEGEADFTCSNAALGVIARGQRVTATATNTATGDTSEFSANSRVP